MFKMPQKKGTTDPTLLRAGRARVVAVAVGAGEGEGVAGALARRVPDEAEPVRLRVRLEAHELRAALARLGEARVVRHVLDRVRPRAHEEARAHGGLDRARRDLPALCAGGLLALEGSTSIKKRYEWEDAEGSPRASGFRGCIALMSDFIVMPAALIGSILALDLDEGSEKHLFYGVAITAALVGNLICNILHVTHA